MGRPILSAIYLYNEKYPIKLKDTLKYTAYDVLYYFNNFGFLCLIKTEYENKKCGKQTNYKAV